MNRLLLIALLTAAIQAQADVNKCTNADGRVSYQETPCATGSSAKQVSIVAAPPTSQPEANAGEPADGMKAVKSIYLISTSINTSASAHKDGMKISIIFKDDKARSVSVKGEMNIKYTVKIYENRDGKPGAMIGSGSGLLINDYGYYLVAKVSATKKTRVIIDTSVTLPDGRKFDGKDSTLFFPDEIS